MKLNVKEFFSIFRKDKIFLSLKDAKFNYRATLN
jgi:hypothetical protein